MRRALTDSIIKNLKVKKRANIADPGLAGHYVRATPSGSKTFVAVARDLTGKQIWHTIGSCEHMTLEAARIQAGTIIGAIKSGRADPDLDKSFAAVADEWLKRHVEAKGLITAKERRRYLTKHILPAWGGRDFTSIKRSDVAKLLDQIEDNAGPTAADAALGVIRSICNWYASRNDDYTPVIIPGMKRTSSKDRARSRILADDELRAIWKQAEEPGPFGALVRLLLLTGQRRSKVASMRWEDVSLDGVWSVPTEGRQKGTGRELVLPEMALDIIKAQPRFASSPYVLAGRYRGAHYSNYGNGKATFDASLPKMPQWGLHDLRRTAKSLMARAGVLPHVSERVLGHTMEGVEGIYDRHTYLEEKAEALRKLAAVVRDIVNPPPANVVHMRKKAIKLK